MDERSVAKQRWDLLIRTHLRLRLLQERQAERTLVYAADQDGYCWEQVPLMFVYLLYTSRTSSQSHSAWHHAYIVNHCRNPSHAARDCGLPVLAGWLAGCCSHMTDVLTLMTQTDAAGRQPPDPAAVLGHLAARPDRRHRRRCGAVPGLGGLVRCALVAGNPKSARISAQSPTHGWCTKQRALHIASTVPAIRNRWACCEYSGARHTLAARVPVLRAAGVGQDVAGHRPGGAPAQVDLRHQPQQPGHERRGVGHTCPGLQTLEWHNCPHDRLVLLQTYCKSPGCC